jgi:hypothetical protein
VLAVTLAAGTIILSVELDKQALAVKDQKIPKVKIGQRIVLKPDLQNDDR